MVAENNRGRENLVKKKWSTRKEMNEYFLSSKQEERGCFSSWNLREKKYRYWKK
jgi:hypothetical protein